MREASFEIRESACEKIKTYALHAYPEEGCGVLLSSANGVIEDVYLMENAVPSETAARHYRIDPLQFYEIEKKAAGNGYEIAGFFHSHPDCIATPSKEDEAQMIPEMLYIIIAVENGRCTEMNGFIKER